MAIRVEDIGEVGYGGLVTLAKWWDEQRMTDGRLSDAEVMKKAETYAYLVPGGAATIMSAFGVMRRQQVWLEHISHGFMYAFPNWIRDVIMSMQGTAAKSAAVREAQRIVGNTGRQLPAGKTGRSYQPEFRRVTAW
jgi:hypothetical protein